MCPHNPYNINNNHNNNNDNSKLRALRLSVYINSEGELAAADSVG